MARGPLGKIREKWGSRGTGVGARAEKAQERAAGRARRVAVKRKSYMDGHDIERDMLPR